jgi:peptide deformylase
VAVKPIRLFGDPVLKTPADPVKDFDKELRTLVKDLSDTMLDAPGVGLAAPQLGVGLRVFTYYVDDVLGHVVNPTLDLSDEQEEDDEGCLSLPGLRFATPRYAHAVVEGVDLTGRPVRVEGTGYFARCLQHECGHLKGRLYVDTLKGDTRKEALRAVRAATWSR